MTGRQAPSDDGDAAWSVGPSVDPGLLALRVTLPRKPAPVELVGPRVMLRPLVLPDDAIPLHAGSDGSPTDLGGRHVSAYDPERLVWRYLSGGPFADASALAAWLGVQDAAPDGRPFAVVDRASGRPVGVANLMANAPEHLRAELGNIWYAPVVLGAGHNVETTWLLLGHLFGLGYRRVEWKCDARNLRSRGAAVRMGFRFEGTFEQHLIVKGRERDTAWYRMLRHEWPDVEPRLVTLTEARG